RRAARSRPRTAAARASGIAWRAPRGPAGARPRRDRNRGRAPRGAAGAAPARVPPMARTTRARAPATANDVAAQSTLPHNPRGGSALPHTTPRQQQAQSHEADHATHDLRLVGPGVRFVGGRYEAQHDRKRHRRKARETDQQRGGTARSPQAQVRAEEVQIGNEEEDERRLGQRQVGVLHGGADVACGTPFVMLTVSAGRATSIAAVPRTYIATMPKPEMTMPRRSVAAASWISSPSVGASSSPANANVMVANRLIDGRPSFAGTSPRSANGVALPCAASDHAASSTKMSAGSHVPYPPRFWS